MPAVLPRAGSATAVMPAAGNLPASVPKTDANPGNRASLTLTPDMAHQPGAGMHPDQRRRWQLTQEKHRHTGCLQQSWREDREDREAAAGSVNEHGGRGGGGGGHKRVLALVAPGPVGKRQRPATSASSSGGSLGLGLGECNACTSTFSMNVQRRARSVLQMWGVCRSVYIGDAGGRWMPWAGGRRGARVTNLETQSTLKSRIGWCLQYVLYGGECRGQRRGGRRGGGGGHGRGCGAGSPGSPHPLRRPALPRHRCRSRPGW